MQKLYNYNKNVYQAAMERIEFIFNEFDYIYVSFSGGKDSGVLLNLILMYMQKNNIKQKIGLFHQDFEAQYKKTTEYVTRTFEQNIDKIDPYWVCLPMAVTTAVSTREIYWYPWECGKEDIWIRSMPDMPYIINIKNHEFNFYEENMAQEELYRKFGKWVRDDKKGKVCCLLGLRSDESLRRYSAIVNKKNVYNGKNWITQMYRDMYSASPIYDWTAEDIWVANAKFDFDYNQLYDLYYKAGQTVSQMRVASPFSHAAAQALNLYRVIEPETWAKIVGRVNGANFGAIYGNTKAMGKNIALSEGHTWKSYTMFLLGTLPEHLREQYLKKFNFSIDFWNTTGGGFDATTIREIKDKGYDITENGLSSYGKGDKTRIIFNGEIPDHTDNVLSTRDIPSWKRMCICILKNDPLCKYMGFGPTKEHQVKIKALKEKYRVFIGGRKNEQPCL